MINQEDHLVLGHSEPQISETMESETWIRGTTVLVFFLNSKISWKRFSASDLIIEPSSAEEMCNSCPANPVINLSTLFPWNLQDLICKMVIIHESLGKNIKKLFVINVLCLNLRPQTCLCQLLANILDRQVTATGKHQSSSCRFTLFLWGVSEPFGSTSPGL